MSFKSGIGSLSPLRTFVLVALLGASAVPAAAQTVVGRLVDQETGRPLDGAFLVLLDGAGVERAATLTNGEGHYRMRAPRSGRYTIRAELIGYASHMSPPLDLVLNETRTYDMSVSFQAIELASIEVTGEQRCRVRPGPGLRTAEVWEEARKALRLTAWTEGEGVVRYRAVGFERDLDPETLRVLSEQRAGRSGYTAGSPYESRPAEDLAEYGYVRPEEDGSWIYFAPDAQVLLSDSFLDEHCFELAEHESRPELIGLAFLPVRRGEKADIRGVLWLDRQSSELRYLEFTFTTLPYPVESALIGGRVDFDRLIGGPWIVRSWRIRAPEVALERQVFGAMRRNEQRYRVTGIHEVGAEVQEVVGEESTPLLVRAAGGGSLTGVVYDARGLVPEADAEILLVGTARSARTGENGTFEMHGLPEGLYEVRSTPASWELPWLPPAGTEVRVREGATSHVQFNLPGLSEVARSLCGGVVVADTLPGVIFGRVIDAESSLPISGREVVVTWADFTAVVNEAGISAQSNWRGTTVVTDGDGWYLACGVPAEALVRIRPVPIFDATSDLTASRLWRPGDGMPSDARATRVGYNDPLGRVDLEVPQANVQEVRARVVDQQSRSGMAGAIVTLLSADTSEIARTTSGSDGFFDLAAPAPGTYLVRIESFGYEPVTRTVVLGEGQSAIPAFVMPVTAIPLDTLEVEASRRRATPQGAVGFSRPSHVLAGERLAVLDKGGVSFLSAVRDFGGAVRFKNVRVGERPFTCIESRRRAGAFGESPNRCYPVAIIVDGIDTGIDDVQALLFFRSLHLFDWESVEFLSPVDAGTRYGLRASDRGALVLWSRGRGPHRSDARGGGRGRSLDPPAQVEPGLPVRF